MAPSVCAAGSVCGRGPGTGLRRNQRGTQGGRRRARARAAGDGHGEGRVRVKFNLKPKHLFSDDEVVRLVGANNELGNWDVGRGKHLKIDDARTDGGDLLTAEVELPKGSFVEFKCVVSGPHGDMWEEGENRSFLVPPDLQKPLSITLLWDRSGNGSVSKTEARHAEVEDGGSAAVETGDALDKRPEGVSDVELEAEEAMPSGPSSWKGKDIVFMRKNEHTRDRQGKWDTSTLSDPAAIHIVSGDKNSPSWREKLDCVSGLIAGGPTKVHRTDDIAYSSIYLQWVGTGVIPCVEGGGHHRPCRHAETSLKLFRSVEWALDRCDPSSFDAVVLRRIYPFLPSFSEEFTASTPLTRIRDIAHRNDIPSELKQEIKHTIQNKLHRNAGPEDLVATEQMLDRITTASEGSYSSDFVREFRTFTEELREFFSASSLAKQLVKLKASFSEEDCAMIDTFLDAKRAVDSDNGESKPLELLDLMRNTTHLRTVVAEALSSGLRNDANDRSIAMRQKYRMAEIALENFAFTLASRSINQLEQSFEHGESWGILTSLMQESMLHLGLDKYMAGECKSIANEFMSWSNLDLRGDRTSALKLKATLERTRRLLNLYRDQFIETFGERSVVLGQALGVPRHNLDMYAESETRASLVFQTAKLCSLALANVRDVLDLSPWDALVSGSGTGTLIAIDTIDPAVIPQTEDAKILMVKRATGDEEVSAAGTNIQGVVLCQDLPHLSHLAIRARQEGIVLATCTSESDLEAAKKLVGRHVTLNATQESVDLREQEQSAMATSSAASTAPTTGAIDLCEVDKVASLSTVSLEDATTKLCGSKASLVGQLSKSRESIFSVPRGACVPFGIMQIIAAQSGVEADLCRHLKGLDEADSGQSALIEDNCKEIQSIVMGLTIPETYLCEIASHFSPSDILIARSSANVEDLRGMSAAGLYDSVLNVPANNTEGLEQALKSVWASLYSRRAVLSRKTAGVPQSAAFMSVLVQEMVDADYSFVLHTVDPITSDEKYVYAEVALGLGETLASGAQGTPWRLRIEKTTGEVEIVAFANFSESAKANFGGTHASMQTIDYSKLEFTQNPQVLEMLGQKLCEIGSHLEEFFGEPQDIEGALCDDQIYVVQSRPQL